MSVTVIVALKIEDYGRFEASFAQRESAREAAGLDVKPYRDMDDANRVVVIGTAPSREAFVGFMTSPEQQQAMQNASIQGAPDVSFLEG